jgi:small-conductance mechanosensitive channel
MLFKEAFFQKGYGMKRLNIVPAVLTVLLLACLVAVYVTRDTTERQAASDRSTGTEQASAVDSRLLDTANRMATLAETGDEQNDAREAQHLADHELDQAFATALRQAASYRAPATGPLRDLLGNVNKLKAQIAADQDRIAQLTKQASADAADQLDLANAQLALERDELDDAQQDLARQGGDPHAAVERALQEHEAKEHETAQAFKSASVSPTTTLVEQARSWFSLGSLGQQVLGAEQQATDKAKSLADQHSQLEKQSSPGTPADGNTADRIANLHRLSDQTKTLAELDQRIQDSQQLAGVYRGWGSLIETRRRAAWHLLLGSLAEILAILLAAILANVAIRRLFLQADRKRLHQVQVMVTLAVQFVAVVLVLLVVFGTPNQVSTIIGLATAGLTVVLRDFIVAFFGWFALMGKNGIRVGDWVEINGVSGEVIQIDLLKTVLLELGNWTDTGHPTGRQVAFSNSFAMDRHYFNFSTAGQWLWDELEVTLPAAGDPYLMAGEIRKLVERETEADSAQAAQDWEHATSQYGARSFSAKPAVNLRPTVNGLEVVVRYITRAPQRYAMKSKLFQVIVDLLHKPAAGDEAATV